MYFKLFRASNDTELSGAGVFTNDVEFTLRADLNQEDSVRLYAKANPGYSISTMTITPTGTAAAKWALAPDVAASAGTYGAWGAQLALGTVTTTNVFFWAKARATSDETPVLDSSVTLNAQGIAAAV